MACINDMRLHDLPRELDAPCYSDLDLEPYMMRPDVWVFNNGEFIFIEVKSCRQDFTSDKKWTTYLEMCHSFYFAVSDDYIKPEELPDGVGLLLVSNGKVTTLKRAKKRKFDVAADVYNKHLYRALRSFATRVCVSNGRLYENMN